ncbi:hypothetical protein I79_022040 [Cricetulus griseus]|uniref:Uncharacterized protein n=1 Tax=Cricetulus griseus TaxID=10029 RepID=G3IE96_CRIGR|nr:hypothetical protein I79_022040 [Cricetulus griseus]
MRFDRSTGGSPKPQLDRSSTALMCDPTTHSLGALFIGPLMIICYSENLAFYSVSDSFCKHLDTALLLKGHYNLEMSKCCERFGEDNGLFWCRATQVLCFLLLCGRCSTSQDLSVSPVAGLGKDSCVLREWDMLQCFP